MRFFANITVNRFWKHFHSVSCPLKMTFLKILYILGHVVKEMKIRTVSVQRFMWLGFSYHGCDKIFNLSSDLSSFLPKYWAYIKSPS